MSRPTSRWVQHNAVSFAELPLSPAPSLPAHIFCRFLPLLFLNASALLDVFLPSHVRPKVSSTETGIVFGTIVYDSTPIPTSDGGVKGALADCRNAVVLNDIHIDIMDYIFPASCSDLAFRAMVRLLVGARALAVHCRQLTFAMFFPSDTVGRVRVGK